MAGVFDDFASSTVLTDLDVDSGTISVDEANNRVGFGDTSPGTQIQVKSTAPYLTLQNSTAENTSGGCESKIIFEDHANAPLGQVEIQHKGSSDDTKGKMILSTNNGSGLVTALSISDAQMASFSASVLTDGSGYLKEKSNADPDFPAYGQLWVKTATPTQLYFTTDAGDDIQLTSGTATAGGGGAAVDDVNLHLHIAVFS
mgnify:CR=1 FL=1|jgi:hypothetical protein|tara:strand:- start:108 stop:710 length:603 start_codon:yes stop_codon:yes gene_type:complete